MIDNITIANRWSSGEGDAPWHLEGTSVRTDLPYRPRLGRHAQREWLHGEGVTVRFVPDTMHSWIEINPTRMIQAANFPLLNLTSIADINVDAVGQTVLGAFGFEPMPPPEARAFLHLERWGVTRVAYPIDVYVGRENVEPILIALAGLKRERQSKAQTWTNRQGTTNCVQFGNRNTVRVMFYDKRDELESKVEPLQLHRSKMSEGARLDLAATADAAAGYIRFEVTLVGVPNIRKVFEKAIPVEWCPTFQLMATRRVANNVLARELRKLGLFDLDLRRVNDGRDPTRRVFEAVREFNGGTLVNGRTASRRSMSLTYAMALSLLYEKQHTQRRTDLESWWGGATSSFKRLERDLRALGLPVLRRQRARLDERLGFFMGALRKARPDLDMNDLPELKFPLGRDGSLTRSETVREELAFIHDAALE